MNTNTTFMIGSTGKIYEVIIYDHTLTKEQSNAVISYLAKNYQEPKDNGLIQVMCGVQLVCGAVLLWIIWTFIRLKR